MMRIYPPLIFGDDRVMLEISLQKWMFVSYYDKIA